MSQYNYILKSIQLYLKHHDYPKINAVNYYLNNKRKFKEESWDEGAYHTDWQYSAPGHLFNQQNALQREVEYDDLAKTMLQHYQSGAFFPLSWYHYGNYEDLKKYIKDHNLVRGVLDWRDEYPENRMTLIEGAFNDPNPDNWFLDDSLFLDNDNAEIQEIVSKWNEQYSHLEDVKNMTPRDWKQFYKECGVPYELSMKDWSDHISQLIKDSPRIQTDCIAWRLGELPEGIGVGETGEFKGFTGLTYNKELIQDGSYLKEGSGWMSGNRYEIKVIIPHGTEGVVLGDSVDCDYFQNELLLNRNQKFIVHEIDPEKRTATIILY